MNTLDEVALLREWIINWHLYVRCGQQLSSASFRYMESIVSRFHADRRDAEGAGPALPPSPPADEELAKELFGVVYPDSIIGPNFPTDWERLATHVRSKIEAAVERMRWTLQTIIDSNASNHAAELAEARVKGQRDAFNHIHNTNWSGTGEIYAFVALKIAECDNLIAAARKEIADARVTTT